MAALVRQAMDDGAIGFGTGLEYVPAAYATLDEVVEIARVAARPGAMYVTHLRDEGARLMPALEEALEVARRTGLRVHVSHVKTTGRANRGQSAAFLRRVDAANLAGSRATFDVYAYTAYSTYSDVVFPAWALAGGTDGFRTRIADAATRGRLKAEMLRIYADQTGGELSSIQFRDGVEGFAGRTLADYVAALGRPLDLNAGLETLIDLQAAGGRPHRAGADAERARPPDRRLHALPPGGGPLLRRRHLRRRSVLHALVRAAAAAVRRHRAPLEPGQ